MRCDSELTPRHRLLFLCLFFISLQVAVIRNSVCQFIKTVSLPLMSTYSSDIGLCPILENLVFFILLWWGKTNCYISYISRPFSLYLLVLTYEKKTEVESKEAKEMKEDMK